MDCSDVTTYTWHGIKSAPFASTKGLAYEDILLKGFIIGNYKLPYQEVIDYITELGAYSYIPVVMSRSIVKVNLEQMEKKSTRYAKIAKEAAEQSHRLKIMDVKNVMTWKNFLNHAKDYDLCLYAYEASPKDDSLKQILRTKKYTNVLVVVGPEGGISDKEVEDLKKNNFLPISLGPRILRTQVAPLYVMSALSYEWEAKE